MTQRVPVPVARALAVLGGWLALYELNVLLGLGAQHGVLLGRPPHLIISFLAAAICLAGALRRRGAERLAWLAITAGMLAWTLGDTYWTTVLLDEASIPVPSWADVGYLAFPVLVFVAFVLLMRPALDVGSRLLLVDGVSAGLAAGALAAAAIFGDVLSSGEVVNLAYAVSDLVLLALVVAAVAVRGWRLNRTWALTGAGIAAFLVADMSYLVAIANDTYVFPGAADVGWTACFVLLAAAAWQPSTPAPATAATGRRATLLPLAFAAVALGVLAQAGLAGGSHVAVVLAVASLVAVGERLRVTFAAHVAMLETTRREALTDSLTGLGNRRLLVRDLKAAVARATPEAPELLVLFDLDGFKHYNDSFGHPSGDALLALLGQRLEELAGAGAYRMGGDEFCVLVPLDGRDAAELCAAGAAALSDAGTGFAVGASFGAVVLPHDADDVEHALRTADQRMYAQKHGGRVSAGRQVSDVLVTALVERDGELGDHVRDVAALAVAVAERLGLDAGRRELVARAALLHDIGKVAVPAAILDKPGPLDDAEWEFMRRHTIVGERIIAAAPAMSGVAAVVRSSHERWDGGGYPDGLRGEEIPLEARIVAVCDAFDAMRTARPYSAARTDEEMLTDLVRCGGTQFDPAVVLAFCAERRVPDAPRRHAARRRHADAAAATSWFAPTR